MQRVVAAAGAAEAAAGTLAQLLHGLAALQHQQHSPCAVPSSAADAQQAKRWRATVARRVARLLAEDTPPEEARRLAEARSFLASV
ncbi:hypothetical protein C2E20_5845 [Micractinium conductrix]|uniref:Uncharacterized protein n=1 Tax=Micractinium conductrix TaxID=554055 RepID=A0A2P6V993_9CHLO|nr:hypothetical protein C2E20_5845 [Micractinium conductrix]|eukprot:PSC70660.1 hypothetical protein C2E20_5845 [Micractinium conductrix]